MKTTVSNYDFHRAFETCRPDNFSHAGRTALFNYLEELEADTGEEIELDVIALCCDFTEYADVQEFVANFDDSYIVWDIEPEEADDDQEAVEGVIDYDATLDKIRDETTVIDVDGESFIIQDF